MESDARPTSRDFLDVPGPHGHMLRLKWERQEGRIAHRIEVLSPSAEILLSLRTWEGSNADIWPTSPPLQTCSLEEIQPGKRAALLVGMAGQSHWSASIEAAPSECGLLFDFACRAATTPELLGTSYLAVASEPWNVQCVQDSVLVLECGHVQLRIVGELAGNSPPPLIAQESSSRAPIAILCPLQIVSRPTTFRWRYRISLHAK